jgi:hypothetical protein
MHRILTTAADHARAAGFDVVHVVDGFEVRAGHATMRVATSGLRIDVSFTPRGSAPLRCQIEGLDAVRQFVDGIVELRDGETFAAELVDRLKGLEGRPGRDAGQRPLRIEAQARPGGTVRSTP